MRGFELVCQCGDTVLRWETEVVGVMTLSTVCGHCGTEVEGWFQEGEPPRCYTQNGQLMYGEQW